MKEDDEHDQRGHPQPEQQAGAGGSLLEQLGFDQAAHAQCSGELEVRGLERAGAVPQPLELELADQPAVVDDQRGLNGLRDLGEHVA